MPSGSSSLKDTSGSGASLAVQLSNPDLYRLLSNMVRRKVPAPDAEDVVQATLADALSAVQVPQDETDLRRWICGIARNKIVDYYRAGRREVPHEEPDLDVSPDGLPASSLLSSSGSEPHSARDLLRWAEGALPESDAAQQTFDWMLREGQGEKLESIAAEAKLPAPQVRKRVSRLRQHLKQKWVLELAAVAALGIAVLVALRILRHAHDIDLVPDRTAAPKETERALQLRRAALQSCAAGDFRLCLEGLDRAAAIDPAGDQADEVGRARAIARAALEPDQLPAGKGPSTIPSVKSPIPSVPAPAPSSSRLHKGDWGKSDFGKSDLGDESDFGNTDLGRSSSLNDLSDAKDKATKDKRSQSRATKPAPSSYAPQKKSGGPESGEISPTPPNKAGRAKGEQSSLVYPSKGNSTAKGEEGSMGNVPSNKKEVGKFVTKLQRAQEQVEHQAVHAQSSGGYLTVPFLQPEPNYSPQSIQQADPPQVAPVPMQSQTTTKDPRSNVSRHSKSKAFLEK